MPQEELVVAAILEFFSRGGYEKSEKKAPTDYIAENLIFLPLGAYGGLGLISPSHLRRRDIIFPQLGQSVKPPFCLAAMRVRISISVWHP